jgi:hypothetical protein
LSVEAFQERETLVAVAPVFVRPVGVEGGWVSAGDGGGGGGGGGAPGHGGEAVIETLGDRPALL